MKELVAGAAEAQGKQREVIALQREVDALDQRIKGLTLNAARMEDLKKDHLVAEAVFSSALARVDTNKADLFASYPIAQVLAPPDLPKKAIPTASALRHPRRFGGDVVGRRRMDPRMAAPILRPETREERIVYYTILWTWGFWVLGALYIVAPVVGWYLAYVALSRYLGLSSRLLRGARRAFPRESSSGGCRWRRCSSRSSPRISISSSASGPCSSPRSAGRRAGRSWRCFRGSARCCRSVQRSSTAPPTNLPYRRLFSRRFSLAPLWRICPIRSTFRRYRSSADRGPNISGWSSTRSTRRTAICVGAFSRPGRRRRPS